MLIIAFLISNGRVLAVDEFLSNNDILFYSPNASSCLANSSTNTTMPYQLPATTGTAGNEEAINESGQVPSGGTVTWSQHASLGKAYQDYYITMRWNYAAWNWDGTSHDIDNAQYSWFAEKPRIVLVTNPRTGKSIYAAALEAGPAPWVGVDSNSNNIPKQGWVNPQRGTPPTYKGIVSGFPPTATSALGYVAGYPGQNGDVLTYQWASDQTVIPGPTGNAAGCLSSTAGAYGWELDGTNSMVYYDQNEWIGNYGIGTIKECGCGPTSLAMIIATLTGDKSVNPQTMSDFYYANNGQIGKGKDGKLNCGSNWNWSAVEGKYSVKVTDIGTDLSKAQETLASGKLVLFSWEGAPFTSGGHIMVMRKYTPDGNIYIASSGGSQNHDQSNQAWNESIFKLGYNTAGNPINNPIARTDKNGKTTTTGVLKGMWSFEKQ